MLAASDATVAPGVPVAACRAAAAAAELGASKDETELVRARLAAGGLLMPSSLLLITLSMALTMDACAAVDDDDDEDANER